MIRKSALVLFVATLVTACASPKPQKQLQTFSPAQFIVTDVTVDIDADPRPDRSFIRLTRSAAENLRQAYNREVINSAGVYTKDLSGIKQQLRWMFHFDTSPTSGDLFKIDAMNAA